jgi:hypothetical protein
LPGARAGAKIAPDMDRPTIEAATRTPGTLFAEAVAHKDAGALRALLHPEIDFRGMTPRSTWEAGDPDGVLDIVLANWFESSDEIDELVEAQTGAFADTERVGYRLAGHNPDGPFVVEQQAYLAERDGRIGWMRVVCSGFRPV